MSFPLEKYRFFYSGNTVIAESKYAGKRVRASAKCDPQDNYEPSVGEKLAAARCNLKVAAKRAQRAERKFSESCQELRKVQMHNIAMARYLDDARQAVAQAKAELANIENDLT